MDDYVAKLRELARELTKAQRQRDKWVQRCEGLESDIAAVRRTAKLMGAELKKLDEEPQPSAGRIAKIVVRATRQLQGSHFTVNNVRELHEAELEGVPTSSISRVLIRMRREGKLEVVEPGTGQRPSVYRVAAPDPASGGDATDEGGAEVAQFRRREEVS